LASLYHVCFPHWHQNDRLKHQDASGYQFLAAVFWGAGISLSGSHGLRDVYEGGDHGAVRTQGTEREV